MFSISVEMFKFCCDEKTRKCTLQNWTPKAEGFYVLSHVPTNADYTLEVINVRASTLGAPFWLGIGQTTNVNVVNSGTVQRIFVPANCTVPRLTIERARLRSVLFEDNSVINTVEIVGSVLREIVPTLVRLVSLRKLQLRESYITRLDLGQFCNDFEKLEHLELDSNRIRSIVGQVNVTCRSGLRTLLLRENQLESVNLDLFSPFQNLTELDVSFNKIRHLPGRLSDVSLASLWFAGNRIKRVSLCDWNVWPEVMDLSVAFNNLTRIPDCLWTLPNVSMLYLQGNQITAFDEGKFKGMNNIKMINLSLNKLSNVTVDPAMLPASLHRLFLHGNCLCTLSFSDQQLRTMGKLKIFLNKFFPNKFTNEGPQCHSC